jgi:hypothetical protein
MCKDSTPTTTHMRREKCQNWRYSIQNEIKSLTVLNFTAAKAENKFPSDE